MDYDIKDVKLAKAGKLRIEWAAGQMSVLNLISNIHSQRKELAENILGGTEETTTGVIRLRSLEKKGAEKMMPILKEFF